MEGFLQSLETWQVFAAVLGALASMGAFIKWLWPILKQGYDNIMGHTEIQGQLHTLEDKINSILIEYKPNGGSSLKDQLIRIEDSLELQNERLRAMMVDSEQLCFEADKTGRVIWANRTVLRTVGRTPMEILGNGWINILAPGNRDEITKKWKESIDQHREFDMQVMWVDAQGEEFPVHVHSYRMVGSDHKTLGYFGTVKVL